MNILQLRDCHCGIPILSNDSHMCNDCDNAGCKTHPVVSCVLQNEYVIGKVQRESSRKRGIGMPGGGGGRYMSAKDNSDTERAERLNKEMADKVRENDQANRNRGGQR